MDYRTPAGVCWRTSLCGGEPRSIAAQLLCCIKYDKQGNQLGFIVSYHDLLRRWISARLFFGLLIILSATLWSI